MIINQLVLGSYQTNCYVLRASESAKDCLIVDTGLEADELIDFLREHNLNPLGVILTHGHADHITGLPLLRENYPAIKVYIHKLNAAMLTGPLKNLSILTGSFFKTAPADVILEDGDIVELAGIKLKVIHTPGHTKGGISLYCQQDSVLFSGDTLFADSVGRTDFPGGSMKDSLPA